MAEDLRVIEPDLGFIQDMQKAGGDTLKKCFQCATCSVVCKLTPDDKPFPRKEMVLAQWGQKEQLMSSPDVWLCHQCGECTDNCPRGAKPGDVLAAIRNASFKANSFPGFMGTMLSRPAYLPFILALPALIMMIVIGLFPTIYAVLPHGVPMFEEFQHAGWSNMPAGPIIWRNFYPELGIDLTFMTFAALMLISLSVGIMRFWKNMAAYHGANSLKGSSVQNTLKVLPTIFKHTKFNQCGEKSEKYAGHLGVFYGFAGAAVTTFFVAAQYWLLGMHTPYPQYSHVKILGNAAAAGIIIGGFMLLSKRMANKKSGSSYYDWYLITLVIGLGVTGLGTELIRLANLKAIAYPTYFLHLLFVAYLFLYLPYSKMAHLAYRAVGMAFARSARRDFVTSDEVA